MISFEYEICRIYINRLLKERRKKSNIATEICLEMEKQNELKILTIGCQSDRFINTQMVPCIPEEAFLSFEKKFLL